MGLCVGWSVGWSLLIGKPGGRSWPALLLLLKRWRHSWLEHGLFVAAHRRNRRGAFDVVDRRGVMIGVVWPIALIEVRSFSEEPSRWAVNVRNTNTQTRAPMFILFLCFIMIKYKTHCTISNQNSRTTPCIHRPLPYHPPPHNVRPMSGATAVVMSTDRAFTCSFVSRSRPLMSSTWPARRSCGVGCLTTRFRSRQNHVGCSTPPRTESSREPRKPQTAPSVLCGAFIWWWWWFGWG